MRNRVARVLLPSLILFFSLAGCGKPPPPPSALAAPKVYPSWYINPQSNDAEHMYATGNGENKDEAVRNALNNMISELGITIESSYESNTEVKVSYSESINKEIKNTIKANVSKIRISNYEIVSAEKMSYKETVVMVRSDKLKFSQSLKKELDIAFDTIAQEEKALQSKDNLQKYNTYTELVKKAQALTSMIMVLSTVDGSFDQSTYIKTIAKLQKSLLRAKAKLAFYVKGDKNSKYFETKIKNFISEKGLNLASKNSSDTINIVVNTDVETSNVTNTFKVATFMVDIKAYANKNRIGGKTLVLKERYSDSMNTSYKNAAIHLEQDMKEQSMEDVIGLNIR
jgi:hypothetical protein